MITYRGKNFDFPVKDGTFDISDKTLTSLPKAVMLLLLAGASRGTFPIADHAFAILSAKMGQYLDNGQLNSEGERVFRKDRELLAALHTPATPMNTRTRSLMDTDVTDSPENSEIVPKSVPTPITDTPEAPTIDAAVPDSIENTNSIDNSASVLSVVSNTSANVPLKPGLAELLTLIEQFLLRFVVFAEPAQVIAVSLWIAHTWVLDAFPITPYLHIYSPTKRCGKSRLLECLHALVCRAWSVVSATEATIMRKIDAESPTLLFDEIDTIYRSGRDKSKEGLRAVLNCGFVRGAKVPRCAGREIIEYSVFCPKAFAGIGDRLPDTIKDRSIRIQLIRRAKKQIVEKLRQRDVEDSTRTIIEGLSAWAAEEEVIQTLQAACPTVPPELGDRAADIAEPLLAIADLAGGEWEQAARASLLALLLVNDEEEADEPGVRLLSAIRDIFTQERKKQMPSIHILRKLASREEEEAWTMQWPREFAGGNTRGPAAKMATLLRPYGISAGTIRQPDGSTPKGYRIEAFIDAFDRYLPNLPEKLATTPHASLDQGAAGSPIKPADTEETSQVNPRLEPVALWRP